jgi:predicted ATP-dependent endonuclease of OLD family
MIKSISIENFRSIKSLYIEPKNLCTLIGPNSTGKTNVLKAIDLVLGEGWTTKAKVARELFHNESEPIKIEISFTEPISHHDKYQGLVPIDRIALTMQYEPEFNVETKLLSDISDKKYFINEEFKKNCHFIYIPSQRDLSDQMRISGWTLLGKLMRIVYENYVSQYNNEEELRKVFKEVMKEPKEFLELDFDEKEVTFKKFSDCFKKYCLENSAGFTSSLEPQLNIYNLNWFYKTLQISVKESHSEKDFDCEEVGAGMQNLILISIFQTYAELMGGKVIFGIEEPELYLYPQAQRSLYKSFQKISEKTQILYTTHNPNFIDASRAYEIELLQKDNNNGTFNTRKKPFINQLNAEKEKFRIYTHFTTERNELFFAKKVILVEGHSEKILFTEILKRKWSIDINEKGISIIECSGKGGVIYFLGLCAAMGMSNFFGIWDQDDDTIDDPKNILPRVLAKGIGLELSPNLEGFLNSSIPGLNMNPKGVDKVKQAFEWAQSVDLEKIPKEFDLITSFLTNELTVVTS